MLSKGKNAKMIRAAFADVVTRRGRPLTLKQQLSRNPKFQGRPLALICRTPAGYVLRAEDVVGKSAAEIAAKAKEVDARAKIAAKNVPTAVAHAIESPSLIRLSEADIIVLRAGNYRGLGGQPACNPAHDISLPREIRLLQLKMGFLKQFSGERTVDEVLRRTPNRIKRDAELVGQITLADGITLLKIINPILLENEGLSLRPPAEALIDVLLSVGEYRELLADKRVSIPTASTYHWQGVTVDELEIELAENIPKGVKYVYRDAARPQERMHYAASTIKEYFLCGIFEVVLNGK